MDGGAVSRTAWMARATLYVLGGSLVALTVTGVPLIWQYQPDSRSLLQDVHILAGIGFVLASVVLLGTTLVARLRRQTTAVGWLAAVGFLVLGQAAGGTGLQLAWDGLVAAEPITGNPRGILTVMEPQIQQVRADGVWRTPAEYRMFAVAHTVVLPGLVLAVGGVARWRLGRSRGKGDAGTPEPEPTSE